MGSIFFNNLEFNCSQFKCTKKPTFECLIAKHPTFRLLQGLQVKIKLNSNPWCSTLFPYPIHPHLNTIEYSVKLVFFFLLVTDFFKLFSLYGTNHQVLQLKVEALTGAFF